MKIWDKKAKIKGEIYDIIEHSDRECENPDFAKAGKLLAPISHGFVNMYQDGEWKDWCGRFYAEKRIIN